MRFITPALAVLVMILTAFPANAQTYNSKWRIMFSPAGDIAAGQCNEPVASTNTPYYFACIALICRVGEIHYAEWVNGLKAFGVKRLMMGVDDGEIMRWEATTTIHGDFDMYTSTAPISSDEILQFATGSQMQRLLANRSYKLINSGTTITGLQFMCGK